MLRVASRICESTRELTAGLLVAWDIWRAALIMAFSRSILRMSSWTAASSLWLMVEEDVVGWATEWREVLGGWSTGRQTGACLVTSSASLCYY